MIHSVAHKLSFSFLFSFVMSVLSRRWNGTWHKRRVRIDVYLALVRLSQNQQKDTISRVSKSILFEFRATKLDQQTLLSFFFIFCFDFLQASENVNFMQILSNFIIALVLINIRFGVRESNIFDLAKRDMDLVILFLSFSPTLTFAVCTNRKFSSCNFFN